MRPTYHPASWMSDIAKVIEHRTLRQLVIPGTHNSGTSLISSTSDLSPESSAFPFISWLPHTLVAPTVAAFSKTQPTTIREQLDLGFRYLDLRVCWQSSTSRPMIAHSMYSHALSAVLDDIEHFLKTSPQEIVIIDFQHFYCMSPQAHSALHKDIVARFDKRLISRQASALTTVHDIWKDKRNIILFYGDDSDGSGADQVRQSELLFWERSTIRSEWADTNDILTLKSFLSKELINSPNDKLFVLQAILSPSGADIRSYAFGSGQGLEQMTAPLSSVIDRWIKSDWKHRYPNIVIVDWHNQSTAATACIEANTG